MALVTFTIPNLTNGVSQQPVTVRLPNQGQEQINSNCRVTDGLSKRNGLQLIKVDQLQDPYTLEPISITDNDFAVHTIKGQDVNGVDIVAQIMVRVSTGGVWVIFLEGPTTGIYELGEQPYLVASKKLAIKFLTNGDATYILNKEHVTANLSVIETSEKDIRLQGSLVYVQQGFFGTQYKITAKLYNNDGTLDSQVVASYSTPDSTTTNLTSLQTSSIRTNLQSALSAALTASVDLIKTYTELEGDNNWLNVRLKPNLGYEATHYLEVEVFSSTARTAIYGYNGTALDVANLPNSAPDGYTVRMEVGGEELDDDYYLKFQANTSGWIETVRLGLTRNLDNQTMPMVLKGIFSEYFDYELDHMPISPRLVGDTISNPDPSFVGSKISDMFIFNNRLGFTSRNHVIMSRIDDYTMFYKTTNAVNLASDRVDLTASVPTTRYSDINHAVPFDKELIMFGDAAQYSLSANVGFDARTASLSTLTEYESDKNVPPLNIGSSIYFPIIRGNYTAIFDLARRSDVGLRAEEITQHIPVYIKGNILEMVHSATENMVFVRTDAEPNIIYVQNRFVRDTTLQQNAWHKWVLPNAVLGITIINSELIVTMFSNDNKYVIRSKIDISLSLITQDDSVNINFTPFLDLIKQLPIGSTIGDASTDYFVLPEHSDVVVGINSRGFKFVGTVNINEALITESLWIGVPFLFSYTFSEQVPAMYNTDGKTAMQYAKLGIQSMKLAYVNSGKFNIEVKPTGRPENMSYFSGTFLGSPLAILGRVNINSGVFKFPVHSRAEAVTITILSNEPYPVTFNTCELQGKLINNSGRM